MIKRAVTHMHNLRMDFEIYKRYNLKVSPLKCAFGLIWKILGAHEVYKMN